MTTKEFINLGYHEASEHLRKAVPAGKRLGSYDKHEDIVKYFGLTDSVWTTDYDVPLLPGGQENITVYREDRWSIGRVRYILKIRYNNDITVDYHVGNTQSGITLKDISFSGIGDYWKDTLPELKAIGLDQVVSVQIPRVYYRNGRKGNVSDMLSKKYGILKLKMDVAISEMIGYIQGGDFVKTWGEVKESSGDSSTKKAGRPLTGILGNHLTSLISDPASFSLTEMVSHLKCMTGDYTKYKTDRIFMYFGITSRYYYSGAFRYVSPSANYEGMSPVQVSDMKELTRKISLNYRLDSEIDTIKDTLIEYSKNLIDTVSVASGLDRKKLEDSISVSVSKNIRYENL